MAKGAISKQKIIEKILSTFSGSFLYDKEIRIPMEEEGAEIQIKVTLTCAKTNVAAGNDAAVPAPSAKQESAFNNNAEITPEEKKEVSNLIEKLGL